MSVQTQNTKRRILAVEDDRTSLIALTSMIEELGFDVQEAGNGKEALDIIERDSEKIDIIVLDKTMPEMDGLEVVARLKDDPKAKHIPIVMVTGASKPEEVKEGIDAGVFYYLTKPYKEEVFKSVITSALREVQRRTTLTTELRKHQISFSFIERAEFSFKTIDEAENLACFLAYCYPSPDTVLPGLASLLINAVEHGNLEIGYKPKSKLLTMGIWNTEVEKRQAMEEYADRKVHVTLECNEQDIRVTIKDEGKGFEWQKYLDIDPGRALDTHGRGIAQANKISFDELQYNDKGNEVTAIVKRGSQIKW